MKPDESRTDTAAVGRSRRAWPALFSRRMDRAGFFGAVGDLLLAALAGGALLAVTRYFLPRRDEGEVTDAEVPRPASAIPTNGSLLFAFGKRPALIVRDDAGELAAFLATCTHLACTVTYDPEQRHIVCPCHQGLFDLEGNVLSGPPPRPLERLTVEVSGNTIHVFRQ